MSLGRTFEAGLERANWTSCAINRQSYNDMANISVLHLAASGCRYASSQPVTVYAYVAFKGKVYRLAVVNKNPRHATACADQHKLTQLCCLGCASVARSTPGSDPVVSGRRIDSLGAF